MARGLRAGGVADAGHDAEGALDRTRALVKANARLADTAAALEKRLGLLEAALESLEQGICVFDREQQLVAWNQACVRLAADPALPLVAGSSLEDVLRVFAETGCLGPGDSAAVTKEGLARFLGDDRPVRERHVRPNGQVIDLCCSATPDGGRALTLTDVTERERLAADLRRSQHELDQFASVASHDLQEPLRVVIGYCELLRRRYHGRLDIDADNFIDFTVDSARRMQALIDDLLAYARVGFNNASHAPTDCGDVVDAALRDLTAAVHESGAQVVCGRLPSLVADRGQLVQLFANLIGNALKYRGDAMPVVEITARREDRVWTFAVTDNGIGIDPRFDERIFEPFKRLHTREEFPGTGIGLAICKRIVEAHGGTIWLDGGFAGGSRFCFTLPAGTTPGPGS